MDADSNNNNNNKNNAFSTYEGLKTPTKTLTANTVTQSATLKSNQMSIDGCITPPVNSNKNLPQYKWIVPNNKQKDIPKLYQTSKWKESCTTFGVTKSVFREFQRLSGGAHDVILNNNIPIQILNYLLSKIPAKIKPREVECICPVIPIFEQNYSQQLWLHISVNHLIRAQLNEVKKLLAKGHLLMAEYRVKDLEKGVNADIISQFVDTQKDSNPTHIVNVSNIDTTQSKLFVNNHWKNSTASIKEDFVVDSTAAINFYYCNVKIEKIKPDTDNSMRYSGFRKIKDKSWLVSIMMRMQKISNQRGMILTEPQKKEMKELWISCELRELFTNVGADIIRCIYECRLVLLDILSVIEKELEKKLDALEKYKSNEHNKNGKDEEKHFQHENDEINLSKWNQLCLINNSSSIQSLKYFHKYLKVNFRSTYWKLTKTKDTYCYSFNQDDQKSPDNNNKSIDFTGGAKCTVVKRWHKKFVVILNLIVQDSKPNNDYFSLNPPHKWDLNKLKQLEPYLPAVRHEKTESMKNVIQSIEKLLTQYEQHFTSHNKNKQKQNQSSTNHPTFCPDSIEPPYVEGLPELFQLRHANDKVEFPLVLFEQTMNHIIHIEHVISSPKENAFLIGVGASVKQSSLANIDYTDNYKMFTNTLSSNLTLIFCFGPVGESFRIGCRQFPELINCTSLDWFCTTAAYKFVGELEELTNEQPYDHILVTIISLKYFQIEKRYNYWCECELSMLDILQMFGRIGRSDTVDKCEDAYLIATHRELKYHVALLNDQLSIESSFISEIVLWNVYCIKEAVEWVNYSYLNIRMKELPKVYQLRNEVNEIVFHSHIDLIHSSLLTWLFKLNKNVLIIYDDRMGRIASYYYVLYTTIIDRFRYYNSIFNILYQTNRNVSLCSPLLCGKASMSELEIIKMLNNYPHAKCMYITINDDLINKQCNERCKLYVINKAHTLENGYNSTLSNVKLINKSMIISTPINCDSIQSIQNINLFILDNLHFIGVNNNEYNGLSMSNASSIGNWLDIPNKLQYNFSLKIPPINNFDKQTIIFESSRNECCRLSSDIIALADIQKLTLLNLDFHSSENEKLDICKFYKKAFLALIEFDKKLLNLT